MRKCKRCKKEKLDQEFFIFENHFERMTDNCKTCIPIIIQEAEAAERKQYRIYNGLEKL